MFLVALDLRRAAQIAATVAAATVALSVTHLPVRAATGHMLVIPANDGYDFENCLAGNSACGRVIADAYCEAHGMSSAVSFGRSDDITASVPSTAAKPAAIEPGSFIVYCAN